jgi:threonine synthase
MIAVVAAKCDELISEMEAMEKNLNLSANTVRTQTQLKKHEVRNLIIIKTLLEGKDLEGDVMKWFESATTLKAIRKARTTITFQDGDDMLAVMDAHPNKSYKDLKKALEDQGFHLEGHTVRK